MEDRGDNVSEMINKDGWLPKIVTNQPDGSYATNDLFLRRSDDTLVQTLGEKTNPVPIELAVRSNSPYTAEAIVFCASRPQVGCLILPSELGKELAKDREAFLEKIWPIIEDANAQAPTQSQLLLDMVWKSDSFGNEDDNSEATAVIYVRVLFQTCIWLLLAEKPSPLIQNVWPVNFILDIDSFDEHIGGALNLINICLGSTFSPQPSFFFSSSVGTRQGAFDAVCAEYFPTSPDTTLPTGYARSKWVVAKVVQRAVIYTPIKVDVFRIGQLVSDTENDIWNETEAWPLIFKSANTTGALPWVDEVHPIFILHVAYATSTLENFTAAIMAIR
ncbi:hypothetical protein PILCRDRAFT_5421 [Piloderma croceum F 1598]|uniref:Thioester reductase (TE) domain-containing protein n=1 Tax=Piloderma croceum (strain F 1598) TaxID=765440 RepID=A0A0C3FPA0_PILCF|nr:hypothetical protein PILCRDRAFT_5421 [Piloderma croceum F 1598]